MNKEEALRIIRSGGSLKEVKDFIDDVEVVKEALKVDWKNIKYASDRLKNDKSIALLAVGYSENALKQVSEKMQNNKDVLIKAFDVSHKHALIREEMLTDLDYLVGVLKVGSNEHKIIEMLSDDTLEQFASNIYPYIQKALNKINYKFSDGFSVRSLMYRIPYAKGIEKANMFIECDYRMNQDVQLLNEEQLFSLLTICDFNDLDEKKVINRIALLDSVLCVERLVSKNILNENSIKTLTEIAIKENSAHISEYLLNKNASNSQPDPRSDLLFYLTSNVDTLKASGINKLLDNITDYKNDAEVIVAFLNAKPKSEEVETVMNSISDTLKSDAVFFGKVIGKNEEYFRFASESLKSNRDFIEESVRRLGFWSRNYIIKHCSQEIRDDDEFMQLLINHNIYTFEFASRTLRSNKQLALKLIQKDPHIYAFVSEDLKSDPYIYRIVLSQNGTLFKELPHNLRNRKELFLLALKNSDNLVDLLQYVDEPLRDNRECALKSVRSFPLSYKYVSTRLKNDEDIINAALGIEKYPGGVIFLLREKFKEKLDKESDSYGFYSKQNRDDEAPKWVDYYQKTEGAMLEFVSDELRSDSGFMLPLIKENPFLYRFALGHIREDDKLIEKVLKVQPFCIKYVPKSYIDRLDKKSMEYYRQFLNEKIVDASQTLEFGSLDDFKAVKEQNIPEIAKKVVSDPKSFSKLSDELKKNQSLIDAIIEINPHTVNQIIGLPEHAYLKAIEKNAYVIQDLYKGMKQNEEFMIKAIGKNPEAFAYALKTMSKKRSFALKAVTKNGRALNYVEDKYRSDKEIVFAALRSDPKSYIYIDPKLLETKEVAQVVYDVLKKSDSIDFDLISNVSKKVPFAYRKGGEKPANFGKKWTSDDLDTLKNSYLKGTPMHEIALDLGRDVYGCLWQLGSLVDLPDGEVDRVSRLYDAPNNLVIIKDTLGV